MNVVRKLLSLGFSIWSFPLSRANFPHSVRVIASEVTFVLVTVAFLLFIIYFTAYDATKSAESA